MKFNDEIKVYGDTSYRGNCPTENAEQITFFSQLKRLHPDLAKVAIHIRNEGKRSVQQTQRQKAEGMLVGASDIIIIGSPVFVCELKRKDHTKSRWQKGQEQFLIDSKNKGAFSCVALGHEAALEAVGDWLNVT